MALSAFIGDNLRYNSIQLMIAVPHYMSPFTSPLSSTNSTKANRLQAVISNYSYYPMSKNGEINYFHVFVCFTTSLPFAGARLVPISLLL